MRNPWNRPLIVTAVALLLALTAGGCGDEVAYDTLYLTVTSDAPTDGSTLDSVRFLAVASDGRGGRVTWPASTNDPQFVLPLSAGANPVTSPVIVKVQYKASTFAATNGVATLQIAGRVGARTVTAWEGQVDLAKKGEIVAHLLAAPGGTDCDADGDGFLDCAIAGCCASADSPFADCEPNDPAANPWVVEDACEPCEDTIDNDCHGGDVPCVDADGDGVADCAEEAASCGVGDPNVAPGLPERCDDVDNDCNNETDEGFVLSYRGQTLTKGASCGTGACEGGTVVCGSLTALACSTEANKSDEVCGNGIDDDCDGDTDEGCEANDVDGDGQAAPLDCNDFDSSVYSGAPEPCCLLSKQGDPAAEAACDKNCDGDVTWCAADDLDGDGYSVAQGDCDDTDPLIYPNAPERCGDGIDQDCIAGDLACDGVIDADRDGWPSGVDCDDNDATVHPGAVEICNGVDDNCDGAIDGGNPGGGAICGSDVGECSTGVEVCNNTAESRGVVLCVGDVRPVEDVCDGLDNDCDGLTDEDYVAGGSVTYDGGPFAADANTVKGDDCGTGPCGGGTVVCGADERSLTCSTLGSSAAETCDGVDNDCDGITDNDFPDYDGDGIADCVDDDEDGDGVLNEADACRRGETGWTSTPLTDHDSDGCRDDGEDDDDDDDGRVDTVDDCPRGDLGWTSTLATDYDEDGCQDALEDDDDDNDGILDPQDQCDPDDDDPRGAMMSEKGWTSTVGEGGVPGTDYDQDGCRDASAEDDDDDNDGILDAQDQCDPDGDDARGAMMSDKGWTSTVGEGGVPGTDYDQDGCRDASAEDDDDDNDGVLDAQDQCDPDGDDALGALMSEKGWTSTVGTAAAPGTDWDGDGCRDATEDDDDDNDGKPDATDLCDPDDGGGDDLGVMGSAIGWTRTVGTAQAPGTDWDDDGCRDADEDLDDDNDGKPDVDDLCDPDDGGGSDLGVMGSAKGWTRSVGTAQAPGTDWDDDGCRDADEDPDDDNDGVADADDRCDPDDGPAPDTGKVGSEKNWVSAKGTAEALGTDWDGDGCKDATEDLDDDNDGKPDVDDLCDPDNAGGKDLGAMGSAIGWTRTVGTAQSPGSDWDDDGCRDADEDPDDDNDGVPDDDDRCDPDNGPAPDTGRVGSEKNWVSAKGTADALGTDWDEDGCKDATEDDDDDNDGKADNADLCDPDDTGGKDLGAMGSVVGWVRTTGTAAAPGTDWDDDGCRDEDEDLDDDNDGKPDVTDLCDPDDTGGADLGAMGSQIGWVRTTGTEASPGTDWDDDGCRDADEDPDDDNDGVLDDDDHCDPDDGPAPDTGRVGSDKDWVSAKGTAEAPGTDWDGDGCRDASTEDDDDDNDGMVDADDRCDPDDPGGDDLGAMGSAIGWERTIGTKMAPGTDWDDDGCQDADEDLDDDNDGVPDDDDHCDPDDGPAPDTGRVGSDKDWTSTKGTADALGTDWDGDGCRDASTEDDDDDNDGKPDADDRCDPDDTGGNDLGAMGSAIGWVRTLGTTASPGTDWDDDGCQDADEDEDDDNDGVPDDVDRCDPDAGAPPDTGAVGSETDWVSTVGEGGVPGTDYDQDGCMDATEDDDDDNDGVLDGADRCDPDADALPDKGAIMSDKGWTSTELGEGGGPGTDYDQDGCQDATEDDDDDNDGVLDAQDQCDPDADDASGAMLSEKTWLATVTADGLPGTDYDGDGCKDDSPEDLDDDNDGKLDADDRCDPDSSGPAGDTGVMASIKNWVREPGTQGELNSDNDDDGCRDFDEDLDDDNDGIPDDGGGTACTGGATTGCDDNCQYDFNPDQADPDADGVGSVCDNCPEDNNPGQEDLDGDGLGLACDDSEDSPGNTCPAATALPLDTTTPGNTAGALLSDSLTADGCPDQGSPTPNDGRGVDQVFAFTAPATGMYQVTVKPVEDTDFILYAFSDVGDPLCQAGECYGWANSAGVGIETLSIAVVGGQTFFLVVDGADGVRGEFTISVTAVPCPARDLFISEYLEDGPGTKALEIYNGTGADVDLGAGGYKIWKIQYGNGTKTWAADHDELTLSGTLAAGDVLVICPNAPDPTLASQCDVTSNFVNWNGNDPVALVKGTTRIDQMGTDGLAGTGWTIGVTTKAMTDHVVRRKSSVTRGNTDWAASAGTTTTNSEWQVLDAGFVAGFGAHTYTPTAATCVALGAATPGASIDPAATNTTPVNAPCPDGYAAVALAGTTGIFVESLHAVCEPLFVPWLAFGRDPQPTSDVGAATGTVQGPMGCASGEVLVGLEGRYVGIASDTASGFTEITGHCLSLKDVYSGTSPDDATRTAAISGLGIGTTVDEADCAPGSLLTGFTGHVDPSGLLSELTIICRPLP